MKPCTYVPVYPSHLKCVFGEGHRGCHVVVYHYDPVERRAAAIYRFPQDHR